MSEEVGAAAERREGLVARVVRELSAWTDEQLERGCASAGMFLDWRWLRLLDSLELTQLVNGAIDFRYVVITLGGALVAVCPFLVTRSRTIHLAYSFEKSFFSGWQHAFLEVRPDMAVLVRWLSRVIEVYRRLSGAAGARTEGWVLAVSPLSFRGAVAVAQDHAGQYARVLSLVLEELQGVAAAEAVPLCFFGVGFEEEQLQRALLGAGWDELFLIYDNFIEVPDGGLEGYLQRFRHKPRRAFRREMEAARSGGIRFEVTSELTRVAPQLTSMYEATYSKYGSEHFHHPPSFWSSLEQYLGSRAEAVLAYEQDELVGFSLVLHKHDLWLYRVGRAAPVGGDPKRLYFNLEFYEPLRRASELGLRRVWLGPDAWEAKRRRGAEGYALHSYFWFPSRRSRALLLPYLRLFTHLVRQQLAFAAAGTSGLKAEV